MSQMWRDEDEIVDPVTASFVLILAVPACFLFLGIIIGAVFDEPVQRWLGW